MGNETFSRYIGQILDNRYHINKILGVGGMAVVFDATDTLTRRNVAVKMLRDDISSDPVSMRRFVNESKAVSMLSHPNIVKIFDVAVTDSYKYLVMEKVEGITLKKYMDQKGALPVPEALGYVRQILSALDHAHAKGIIHRDIKPQNIMLLKNGQIKVTDFGIAKLPDAETLTMADKAIGTVFYISPEQASAKKIDTRSDIYSLGAVLYEMVTGDLPFNADSPVTVAMMQVNSEPRRPREILHAIPPGVEQIILKAMQKAPEKRFQSAASMAAAVDKIIEDPSYVFRGKQISRSAENDGGSGTRQFGAVGRDVPARQTPQRGSIPSSRPSAQRPPSANTKKKKKKKKEPFTIFPIILGILIAFFLVAAVAGIYLLMNLLGADDSKNVVTIPTFVGDIYSADYASSLEKQGYKLSVTEVFDDTYPAGTVIAQSPSHGERRVLDPSHPSCDLSLTVSKGAELIVLPELAYYDHREAESRIRSLGLICTVENENDPSVPEGFVIRTIPASGSKVRTGASITLCVSSGAGISYVKVPSFVGKDEITVARLMDENNLIVGNVSRVYDDTVEKGVVISQSIEEGTEVAENLTEIDFVVSKGKDPTPPETTGTPDTTSSPDPVAPSHGGDLTPPNPDDPGWQPPDEETTEENDPFAETAPTPGV